MADGGMADAVDGACVTEGVLSAPGAGVGVGCPVVGPLAGEADAAAAADCVALPVPVPGVDPGVPDGVYDWAGAQADSAARLVPASRRRLKARRLSESGLGDCRPNAPSVSS